MGHLLCLALCWTQTYTVGAVYEPEATRGLFPVEPSGQEWVLVKSWGTQEEHCWEAMPPVKPLGSGLALELSILWVLIYHHCALSSCILGS